MGSNVNIEIRRVLDSIQDEFLNRHYENNHLTDKDFDHLKLQIKQHIAFGLLCR